ncbi:MAG TPA: fumarylacetoacetate hydrolase family protein [Chitinophagales bacterium]|nr:fumarylacetoacetate hydrolase family protein [Chitinophagales bacterium]
MKIICIGRNYAEHAKELNNPVPQEPVIFMKPSTALTRNNKVFFYPEFTKNLHYEGELVLKISRNGRHIAEKFARKYFDEITVGIDLTARDLQNNLREQGLPWEVAKAFDGSAVVGNFVPLKELTNPADIHFTLRRNGETVQDGHSSEMLFGFEQIITWTSRFFTLLKGDLIFTGTPRGVGEVKVNDVFEGLLEGKKVMACRIK